MVAHRELVTVDLGNSTCKACVWRLGRDLAIGASGSWPTRAGLGAELTRWLSAVAPVAPAALSSVAAAEVTLEVEHALDGRLVRSLVSGLASEYLTPDTLGSDRLFAARGAVERVGRSCIVVDAGTAVTVDAVRVRDDGVRVFLGGAIAPGPMLLARSLHEGTARLPEVELRPGVPALGRDTRSAVLGGVVHGFAGLVRGLVESVARDAGLGDAPVVLGGGARALLGADPCPSRRVVVLDELVHLGLALAARDALGEARR